MDHIFERSRQDSNLQAQDSKFEDVKSQDACYKAFTTNNKTGLASCPGQHLQEYPDLRKLVKVWLIPPLSIKVMIHTLNASI